ncbi:hypothetical protein ACFOTA_15340 [Chitinophaga sp. GCM10012297]|uniref:Tetratricopeptide repeat protein n=1 Tax=Chitinophaga chungangae TaxID=2821488 RepID=A0ABS3YHN8_9BACT|nr:hypothetical protein [Chitinophaga chungangae]MBO9153594.1 hypothetical protein [Chitinophaga chungangae]
MKNLLLFVIIMTCSAASFAQLAKMQFEDAEAAYGEGKFAEAVKLLDEAEQSNKGANPPIMHLRILARVELIKQNPDSDFDIIDKARKETGLFLKQYNGNAQLEDKYREVYQASKVLKDLPLTREAFEEVRAKEKKANAEAELAKNEKKKQFLLYSLIGEFPKGTTLEAFRKKHKLKDWRFTTEPNGDRRIGMGEYSLVFRGGKIIGYVIGELGENDQGHEDAKADLANKVAYFTNLFGFEPEVKDAKYTAPASGTFYTWAYEKKTFIVESSFTLSGNMYKWFFYYYDYDES